MVRELALGIWSQLPTPCPAQVNSMLEDQLNTREAYSSVACRWLQSNTQTWQAWLPKARSELQQTLKSGKLPQFMASSKRILAYIETLELFILIGLDGFVL